MSARLECATGAELDAIGLAYGVQRLPREPDTNFRNRIRDHIAAWRNREWGL